MAERPGKTQRLTFPKRAGIDELARLVLNEQVRVLLLAIKQSRSSRDPEQLHQLRVSVRKLRVALRTFEERLDASLVRALTSDLRWIFQRLGAVREYDVLLRDLALDDEPASGRALALRKELMRRRGSAARAVEKAMTSARYARLRRALRALTATLEAPGKERDRSAKKWARKRLERRLARVRELGDACASGDAQRLHELRKQLKKLRYAADILAPLWPRKRKKAFLRPLEELQDLLGTLNDTAVAERLLAAAAKRASAAAPVAEQRARMLDATAEPARRRAERRVRRFVELKPFWS